MNQLIFHEDKERSRSLMALIEKLGRTQLSPTLEIMFTGAEIQLYCAGF